MSSDFAALLQQLDCNTPTAGPPKTHTKGLAYVAWQLWSLMSEAPENVRLTAIKEIVDRCQGRPGSEDKRPPTDRRALMATLQLHRLTPDESRTLGALLDKTSPLRDDDGRLLNDSID